MVEAGLVETLFPSDYGVMRNNHSLFRLLLAFSLLFTSTMSAAEQSPSPSTAMESASTVVKDFNSALVASMKGGEKLGFEGRYKMLSPVVDKTYDFPFIARLSVGSHWASLSPQQKDTLVQTLKKFTIANYAAEFDRYEGQKLTVDSTQQLRPGTDMVKSTFVGSRGKNEHTFDYLLHKTDSAWKVINVVVDGVSDLSLKRSEYTEIIESQGFGALISKLQARIAELSTKNT